MANSSEFTPIPKGLTHSGKVAVLMMAYFIEAMSICMLFPFVAYMVHEFWKDELDDSNPETDKIISMYAGFIASAYNLSQFFSCFIWGYISDRIGRRPVLLIGMFSNLVTAPLFGLARSFEEALIYRLLSGLINGNIVVSRAYAREISDKTNSARIFSNLGFSWGMGIVLGPMLGGLLSHPTRRVPIIFTPGGFWDEYPYLLPMLFNSAISCLGFIIGLYTLEEVPRQQVKVTTHYRDILKNKSFIATTSIYAISGAFCIGFQEVFAFWCKTQRTFGGLGWSDESNVGIVQSAGGLAVIAVQFIVTPILMRKKGALYVIKYTCILFVPTFICTSFLNLLSGWQLWSLVILLYVIFAMLQSVIITACGVATNNTVSSDQLGITNGISQASIAIFRAIGPATCGMLFGWSTNNGLRFPFDSHLFFIFVSCLAGVCILICNLYLDDGINVMKESQLERSVKEPLLAKEETRRGSYLIE